VRWLRAFWADVDYVFAWCWVLVAAAWDSRQPSPSTGEARKPYSAPTLTPLSGNDPRVRAMRAELTPTPRLAWTCPHCLGSIVTRGRAYCPTCTKPLLWRWKPDGQVTVETPPTSAPPS